MQPAVPPEAPLALTGTRRFELVSRHTGHTYEVLVSVPLRPPPPQGYPVVYLLDGNAHFPVAHKIAQAITYYAKGTEVAEPVIVGVGYPGVELLNEHARAEDYTPPAADLSDTGDARNPRQGGADRFLTFLDDELWPALASRAPLDASRRTIMGHSYGGLLALHAWKTRPGSFSLAVAGSPSIWWNHRSVLEGLAPRADGPALLITVGSLEQTPPARASEDRARMLRARQMIDNAQEAARRSGARLMLFEGFDHYGSALPMLRLGLLSVMAPSLIDAP